MRLEVSCLGGLCLADPANHREHVVFGARLLALGQLPRRDTAYQLVVDPVDLTLVAARLERRVVALEESKGEVAFGPTDRTSLCVVKLDGQVGDSAGGDVGSDVHLASPYDPEVDHGLSRGRIEPEVGRRHAGLFERGRQRTAWLLLVDPAQELPDGTEVFDVIDQRRTGERHHQWSRNALTKLI